MIGAAKQPIICAKSLWRTTFQKEWRARLDQAHQNSGADTKSKSGTSPPKKDGPGCAAVAKLQRSIREAFPVLLVQRPGATTCAATCKIAAQTHSKPLPKKAPEGAVFCVCASDVCASNVCASDVCASALLPVAVAAPASLRAAVVAT